MVTLVVGATGLVGAEICRLLRERGHDVRALVRDTSSPDRIERLKSFGASLAPGDLKDRASLDAACARVDTVVSTASSTLSRQEGDSIETVDHRGQLALVDAAKAEGVQRFVFVSFPHVDLGFPLQTAKRAVEARLRNSGMVYTILHPTFFMEVWLSPALGFDAAGGAARIYGAGENKISWISFQDVARFAAIAAESPQAANTTIELGGPDALSPHEAVRLAEQATGKPLVVDHVPEAALQAQYDAADEPLQKSFAALMLYYARGHVIDTERALRTLPVASMKTVRQHLEVGAGIGNAV